MNISKINNIEAIESFLEGNQAIAFAVLGDKHERYKLVQSTLIHLRYSHHINVFAWGLLHEPYRTEGNQRRYVESHLKRLQFIRHARELGFSQEDIRELINLSAHTESNHQADEIATKHLKEVENKIIRLNALKKELSFMLDECKHGQSINCSVIDVLSDHTLCKSEH